MTYFLRVALVVVILVGAGLWPVALSADIGPGVNYISADAVYVNIGSAAGLSVGSRLQVIRGARVIAVLEVVHISSHSASCQIESKSDDPRVGDAIFFDRSSVSTSEPESTRVEAAPRRDSEKKQERNAVRGHISLQNQWFRSLGESELSSVQPGVSARLTVDDIFGLGGTLRVRHHTRFSHRSRALSMESDTDEWSHRVSEFGVYFPIFDDPYAVGLGRIINPYMRGLGCLDGGYVALRVHPRLRMGVAGGMDPNIEDSSLQPNHQSYGVFLSCETGSLATRRFTTTLALSGSYRDGAINREFGYIQNTLSVGRRLSIFHSMEVDVNRGWRKTVGGESIAFSNMYFTSNVSLSRWLNVDVSYDARRNMRDYRTHELPDSLFNDVLATGYSGGVSLSMPGNVRFRARAGVRYREDVYTNRFGSISLHIRNFPLRRHSVLARLSVSETPYVTGYNSLYAYRVLVTRRIQVNLGAGSYIYKQADVEISSTFGEVGVHYTLGRRYYVSGSFRRLAGDNLNSTQVLTEIGLSF